MLTCQRLQPGVWTDSREEEEEEGEEDEEGGYGGGEGCAGGHIERVQLAK